MRSSWNRIAAFYALSFILLIAVPLLHAATSSGPMDFDAAAARASEKTGLPWTSNLLVVARLALAEPSLWLLVLGSAVPSLAAVIVCVWAGPASRRQLFGRFALRTPGGEAVRTYSLMLGLLVAGLLCVYALRSVLPGPEYSRPAGLFGPALVGALLTAAFLDQGAVLEELGWRGFAQPTLQGGLLSPLGAAVLVGVGWGLWHVPRDVVAGVIERLGMVPYTLLFLPSFVAGCVAISIIASFFVNRCHGSVIPAIVVHGLSNDAIGLSGTAAMGLILSPYHQVTKALPFALIAAALVALSGRRLGLAPRVAD